MNACAVIVAAGAGKRFGAGRPKQFLSLNGKPLLYWSLKAFQRAPGVGSVVLVVPRDFVRWAGDFVRRERLSRVSAVVSGGKERPDSVRAGVLAAPADAEVLMIHDAARALISPAIISRVAAAARKVGTALAAWPVPDTLKLSSPALRAGEGRGGGWASVRRTIPRTNMWLAQTPQAFRRDVADAVFGKKARGNVMKGMTDDVQLAERAGFPVALVAASPANFKVTLPEDFSLCRAFLEKR